MTAFALGHTAESTVLLCPSSPSSTFQGNAARPALRGSAVQVCFCHSNKYRLQSDGSRPFGSNEFIDNK